jgi:hypothetical protein
MPAAIWNIQPPSGYDTVRTLSHAAMHRQELLSQFKHLKRSRFIETYLLCLHFLVRIATIIAQGLIPRRYRSAPHVARTASAIMELNHDPLTFPGSSLAQIPVVTAIGIRGRPLATGKTLESERESAFSAILHVLRTCLGGELSTDKPSRLTHARLKTAQYGAISLPASFSHVAAGLRGPELHAPRSIFRTLVRVLTCALHYFAAAQIQLRKGNLTGKWHATTIGSVLSSQLERYAVNRSRQAPLLVGFCRL